MNWDPFQREVLAELGHVVYRQAGIGIAMAADAGAARSDALAVDIAMVDSLMLARVACAAGMTTETLQACIDDICVIADLRGNASAKRAIWPRLRALRRQRG